jgi:hypothetical protein
MLLLSRVLTPTATATALGGCLFATNAKINLFWLRRKRKREHGLPPLSYNLSTLVWSMKVRERKTDSLGRVSGLAGDLLLRPLVPR